MYVFIYVYIYIYIYSTDKCIYMYVCIMQEVCKCLEKRAKRVIIFKIREDIYLNCISDNVSCNLKNSILEVLLLGFALILILSFKFHFNGHCGMDSWVKSFNSGSTGIV